MRANLVALFFVAPLACAADPQPAVETTGVESSGAGTSSSSSSGSSSAGSSASTVNPSTTVAETSSESEGGGPKLDVSSFFDSPSHETEADEGCKKVDVIISIDHSDSMYEEIAAMAGPAFDSFPTALLAVNQGLENFQLGVMDACNNPAILHDTGMTAGACDFSTGTNYMSSNSPNLFDEYHCVTDLAFNGYMGTADFCSMNNDDEQPANTAADAINNPFINDQNDGFLRDDAVLFVVAMTDEDEQPVPFATPQQIYDKIVEAKGGDVNAVVFLGVAGGSDCLGPYGSAQNATNMKAVTQLFIDEGQGMFWDLCGGQLEMAFEMVLETIDSACVNFDPPN